MIRRIAAAVLTFALAGIPAGFVEAQDGETVDRTADLRQLEHWALIDRSLDTATRIRALRTITGMLQSPTGYSEAQFYMAVRRIVALAENGHSNVTLTPAYERFGVLPLRTYWFADGMRIVRAHRDHARLLGARITHIAGRPIEEIETSLMDYVGGNDAYFRAYHSNALLLSPALLHAIDLCPDPTRLALGLIDRDGQQVEVTLGAPSQGSSGPRDRPWRYLVPAPIDGEDGEWSTLHDPGVTLPLAMSQTDALFRYEALADGQVAYVQLRANIGRPDNSVRDFVAEARQQLEAQKPRVIIFDNRQNPGGDLTRTADFALALPELAGPDGHVYVMTSGATFSAGIYSAFFPKAADPERTTVVGQHVGDWTRFWAETWTGLSLPDTGYRIGYSLQLHDLGAGCNDPERCHIGSAQNPSARWNVAVGTFDPDIPVADTFEDYLQLRDAALERVLREAGVER